MTDDKTQTTAPDNSQWRWIAAGAALLALAAAWHFLPLKEWLDLLGQRVSRMGVLGGILYFAVYVVASLLFVPGSILTLAAGYLFGVAGGMVVVWAATTATATIAFLIARHVARRQVERYAKRHPRYAALDDAIGRSGWKVVALLRLSAIVPFSLSNYFFGLTSVDFASYVATTAVAMLPGTFFYVYLGAAGKSLGKGEKSPWEWALIGAGVVATVVTAVILARVVKKYLKS